MQSRAATVLTPDDDTDTANRFDASALPGHTTDAATDLTDPDVSHDADEMRAQRKRRPAHRTAAAPVVAIVIVLSALTGWLAWQAKSLHDTASRDASFVDVARQAAVNLTTIDSQHADADVRRITDSATGAFYDDFSNRSKPFVDAVEQLKSKSTGTVTAAGLESASHDDARVLVAVSVKTSSAAAPQEQLRAWRLRVTVTRVGDDVKVSNVEFVP
ncbi:hypothetical protein [Mycobacterium sp.]|uniref:hypothetical protein n=1 Tax=Mycobacterium sp. TaxID=1785 RepID=UPI002C0D97B4|nr:hypothetical protein [Mycobacterium sp.]HKP42700.1 hypothetical protein [Mycobacterium sp.]